jgi:hypothetical protein
MTGVRADAHKLIEPNFMRHLRTSPYKRPSIKDQKIGLLLSETTEYGRGVLRGIANFAKDYPNWQFNVVTPTAAGVKTLKRWQPDGLIVMINQKNLVRHVLALSKPICLSR